MAAIDPDDITTFWKCIPEPEQIVLRAIAEMSQVAFGSFSYETAKNLLAASGGLPAEQRADVLWTRYKLVINPENPFNCFDPKGCVNFILSPFVGQIWSCMLQGGCTVGSPEQLPCRSPLTKPYA